MKLYDTTDLERSFRQMRRQAQSVARDIDRTINGVNGKGIKIKVDLSELEGWKAKQRQYSSSATSRPITPPSQKQDIKVNIDTSGIEAAVGSMGKSSTLGKIGSTLAAPFKAAGQMANQVLVGALEGVGTPIGRDIGEGIQEGIQRETGDIVGSFRLVSREVGAEFSQAIVDSLGEDADTLKAIFAGVLGKETIAIEAAAKRQVAGQQRRTSQRQASAQIQREFEFVRANLPEIKARGQALQSQREELGRKNQVLQSKIATAAEAMGAKQLEQRLEAMQQERQQIIEAMAGAEDGTAMEIYQAQLQKLADSYHNTQDSLEKLNQRAANRYQLLADQLSVTNDQLLQQERAFAKVISPIENIDFVAPFQPNQHIANKISSHNNSKLSIQNSQLKTVSGYNSPVTANLPSTYRHIAEEVLKASGTTAETNLLPQLVASAKMPQGSFGLYRPGQNQIEVPPEMMEAIQAGNLTAKQVETLVHELRHAVQFGFGQGDVQAIRKGAKTAEVELLKPNAQELKQFRLNIEGSVRQEEPQYQAIARKIEADAYAFAARNAASIQAKVTHTNRVSGFQQSVGIGGAKAERLFKQSQLQALKKLQGIKGMVAELGLDEGLVQSLESNFTETVHAIYGLDKHLETVLEEAAEIELLPIEEIDSLEKRLLEQVAQLNQVANQYAQDFFEQVKNAKQSPPVSPETETELSFADTLREEFTAKGLREVAGKLNIGGLGSANKERLVQAIAVVREHHQERVEQLLKQLGDSIRKQKSATGQTRSLPRLENFAEIKSSLQQTGKEIAQAMEMLASAQGQERRQLLEAIVTEIDQQTAWIDQLTNTLEVTGKEKQSLTAYRNLFVSARGKPNAELMNIQSAELNQLSNQGRNKTGVVQGVNTIRGNSFDAYHSVANIQNEIDQLLASAMGNYQPNPVAYHSVADIQEEINNLVAGLLLRLRKNSPHPPTISAAEGNLSLANAVNIGSIPLPDNQEAEVVARLRNSLDKFEQVQNQINQRFNTSAQEVEATLGGLGDKSETLVSRLQRVFKSFQSGGLFPGFKMAREQIGGLIKSFIGFQILSSLISLVGQFTPELLEAGMAMESLERRIGFVSGSSQKASQNLAFVRSEVKRLGIDLQSSMEGFAGLMAASRETPLEGAPTKQIFAAVSQASTVYDLNAQQQERVFTATQQMMSKGVISSEELRQQLGESLPGAFQIAARAMGVTTQELSKMLEQGQVLSEDFLPKFAQQLSAETANGVAGAANSSVSAVTAFNNAVYTGCQLV